MKQNQETEPAKMKRDVNKGFNTFKKVFTKTEEEKTSKSSLQSTFAARSSSISKGLKYILKLLWRLLKSSPTDILGPGTFQVCELVGAQTVGGLPEGVSEVHAPPFQLLGVVGRHVGKLPEDVEICGVS